MEEEKILIMKLKKLRLQESLLRMDEDRKEELTFLQEEIRKIRKEYSKVLSEKIKNEKEGNKNVRY